MYIHELLQFWFLFLPLKYLWPKVTTWQPDFEFGSLVLLESVVILLIYIPTSLYIYSYIHTQFLHTDDNLKLCTLSIWNLDYISDFFLKTIFVAFIALPRRQVLWDRTKDKENQWKKNKIIWKVAKRLWGKWEVLYKKECFDWGIRSMWEATSKNMWDSLVEKHKWCLRA